VLFALCVLTGVTVVGVISVTTLSTSNLSASESDSSTQQEPWQVVNNNVTVTGKMAEVITCETPLVGLACPALITSINNIQLIKYQGNYYYVENVEHYNTITSTTYTIVSGRTESVINVRQGAPAFLATVWFTNSSVYCISPAVTNSPMGSYPTCPGD
jgi:hypothetical protein